jgi:hypothetical protein
MPPSGGMWQISQPPFAGCYGSTSPPPLDGAKCRSRGPIMSRRTRSHRWDIAQLIISLEQIYFRCSGHPLWCRLSSLHVQPRRAAPQRYTCGGNALGSSRLFETVDRRNESAAHSALRPSSPSRRHRDPTSPGRVKCVAIVAWDSIRLAGNLGPLRPLRVRHSRRPVRHRAGRRTRCRIARSVPRQEQIICMRPVFTYGRYAQKFG